MDRTRDLAFGEALTLLVEEDEELAPRRLVSEVASGNPSAEARPASVRSDLELLAQAPDLAPVEADLCTVVLEVYAARSADERVDELVRALVLRMRDREAAASILFECWRSLRFGDLLEQVRSSRFRHLLRESFAETESAREAARIVGEPGAG